MSSMNIEAINAVFRWQEQTGRSILDPGALASTAQNSPPVAVVKTASAVHRQAATSAATPPVAPARPANALATVAPMTARPVPFVPGPDLSPEEIVTQALPIEQNTADVSGFFDALAEQPELRQAALMVIADGKAPAGDTLWQLVGELHSPKPAPEKKTGVRPLWGIG